MAWRAGVSKVCISPQEPIWLDGWGSRDTPSQGISMDICESVWVGWGAGGRGVAGGSSV